MARKVLCLPLTITKKKKKWSIFNHFTNVFKQLCEVVGQLAESEDSSAGIPICKKTVSKRHVRIKIDRVPLACEDG